MPGYLKQVNKPKLSDEDKLVCEGKLSVEECWSALQSMSNGKVQVVMVSLENSMFAFGKILAPVLLAH